MDGEIVTRIKICGFTNLDDAREACAAGADALGFVFAESKRRIAPDTAREIIEHLPPLTPTVGVFMNQPRDYVIAAAADAGLNVVQLHGDEAPRDCAGAPYRIIKRFNISETATTDALRVQMRRYRVSAYLLDPGAGDGKTFDWRIARGLPAPLIVSGGLTPDNVASAIRTLRPYAVDVCSGVEAAPGRKDPERVRAFIEAVRKTDDEHER